MKVPKCFEIVKAYIVNHIHRELTLENTARELGLTEGEVHQCFHILNLQGILSQAKKPFMAGMGGDWKPNRYTKLQHKWPGYSESEGEFYEDV